MAYRAPVEASMKHRKVGRSFVALLSAVLVAAPAAAAEAPAVEPGQRVRVTAAAPGLFHGVALGTLMKVGPNSLTVADAERGAVTELPLDAITRLEVSQGRRRHTRLGALIGTAVGLALAPFVWSDNSTPCGDPWEPRECTKAERTGFAVMGVALCAGGGAWWGHRTETEQWRDSAVQRLKMTARPEHGGGRVALTLAF
jgi:hypothetical protein